MRFIKLCEKNGDLSIINVDSIHAVYKDDGACAIDYGNSQTIFLDIPIEEVALKLEGFLYRKEVFE